MGSETLWPLGLYFLIALVVAGSMIGLSFVLGERHSDRATGQPYESGILSTGSARVRLSVKFYIVAMLFVIFDLEAVFIFAYAVAYEEVGWAGYAGLVVFVVILVVALIYEYRMGALDWEPVRLQDGQGRSGERIERHAHASGRCPSLKPAEPEKGARSTKPYVEASDDGPP